MKHIKVTFKTTVDLDIGHRGGDLMAISDDYALKCFLHNLKNTKAKDLKWEVVAKGEPS